MTIKLPFNPATKSRRLFDFTTGPEVLSYCHEIACRLVDLCEALTSEEKIQSHLNTQLLG
jgi:hypothetical protein